MGSQSNRGSSFGVSVSTSKDFASEGVASGTVGGQIADVTFTITSGDLVSGAVVDAVITFTISSPQFYPSQLSIAWPRNFFLSGQMRYKLFGGVENTIYATDTFIPVATTQQQQLLPGRHSITLIGVTLGGPVGSYPSGISVSTMLERAGSTSNPSIGDAPGFVNGCTPMNSLSLSGCGQQQMYMIQNVSPAVCPSGFVFAPNGIDLNSGCPREMMNFNMDFSEICFWGSVPSSCSIKSAAISNIPNVCGFSGFYYAAPGGIDSAGCPNVPSNITDSSSPSSQYCSSSNDPSKRSKLRLSFAIDSLCTPYLYSIGATRDCYMRNASMVQGEDAIAKRLLHLISCNIAFCSAFPSITLTPLLSTIQKSVRSVPICPAAPHPPPVQSVPSSSLSHNKTTCCCTECLLLFSATI